MTAGTAVRTAAIAAPVPGSCASEQRRERGAAGAPLPSPSPQPPALVFREPERDGWRSISASRQSVTVGWPPWRESEPQWAFATRIHRA